jgi:hypothetical protein
VASGLRSWALGYWDRGSESRQDMDVGPRLFVLRSPVQALRLSDPPSRESYQIPNLFIFQKYLWIETAQKAQFVKFVDDYIRGNVKVNKLFISVINWSPN